ncbi:hypothetical protein BDV96DRAFT_169322 [Lophiotrema nucula]|uniref:DUF899-domain-containing protein n=1 Tax=Lophiotrema nucula TaxID=690887 RepID=A0A6A5YZ71_9PLEO|nr:hypothetical protein BDV96DRAFT_169322 [Lophiotrema nucula]
MAQTDSPYIPDPAIPKWPVIASENYVAARRALLEKEYALINQVEEVAAERRKLLNGPIMPAYTFEEGPADLSSNEQGHPVTLEELARPGDLSHTTLVVYHMMMEENAETPCSGCAMFVDGLNGVAKHLAQRFNLAIIAKAPLPAIRAYAQKRGWNDIRLLSSAGTTFNKDMNAEAVEWSEYKGQMPAISVFKHEKGEDDMEGTVRFWYQTMPHFGRKGGNEVIRGMDLLTVTWNIFDITPEGRGDWDPSNDYVEEWKGVKV